MNKLILIGLFAAHLACGNASLSNNASDKISNANDDLPPPYPVRMPTPAKEPEIKKKWQQQSDDLTFDWDGGDLSAIVNGNKISHIFKRISEERIGRIRRDRNARDCDVSHFFGLASVVGTTLSFEQEEGFICGTTSIDWRYTTIDLNDLRGLDLPSFSELEDEKFNARTTTPMVSLTKWFTEDEILQALLANQDIASGIERAIRGGKVAKPPASLVEFGKLFSPIDYDSFGELFLEKDFLTRFAFHHIDGNRVAVWISLTPTSHASQAVQDHIEIFLPVPEKLRQDLLAAEAGKAGFLMKDKDKYVGNTDAEFEYDRKK